MRSTSALLVDAALVTAGSIGAILLRDNIELGAPWAHQHTAYVIVTGLVSLPALAFTGSNRSIWRFNRLQDYLRVAAAMLLIAAGTAMVIFAYNRLDGIPRSIPILQFMIGTFALVGTRVIARIWFDYRRQRDGVRALQMPEPRNQRTVLLIGLTDVTEMYLRLASEQSLAQVRIAGILGRSERQVGRLVGAYAVLGQPEQVADIVRQLSTHGVFVDAIVVTVPLPSLSSAARTALAELKESTAIEVVTLTAMLGLEPPDRGTGSDPANRLGALLTSGAPADDVTFQIDEQSLAHLANRPYWLAKRTLDIVLAAVLLLVLSPVIALVAIVVAVDCGLPLVFWQQRPGLAGLPFRLLKFRTMGAAHAFDGRKLHDSERLSWVGKLLRRTRADELPQLINILAGEMSFVGPRPLLPVDQSPSFRARLMVRPGLTGWAQVVGGRTISADDKAALDVWYVQNAALALDVSIIARTIGVVVFGEHVHANLVQKAWQELQSTGTYRGASQSRRVVPASAAAKPIERAVA